MIQLRKAHENAMAALSANLPERSPGVPTQVGDDQAPIDPVYPYVIFYAAIAGSQLANRGLSGGLGVIEETVQVSVVAETRESLDIIADSVRWLMVDAAISFSSVDVAVSNRLYVTENQNQEGGAGAPRHGTLKRLDLRFSMWISQP
jgi:hypothetical protein